MEQVDEGVAPENVTKTGKTVATKFFVAVLMFVALAGVLLGSGLWSNQGLTRALHQIVAKDFQRIQLGQRVEKELLILSRTEKSAILARSNLKREPLLKALAAHTQLAHQYVEELLPTIPKREAETSAAFKTAFDGYMEDSKKVLKYIVKGKPKRAFRISNGRAAAALVDAELNIRKIIVSSEESINRSTKRANARSTLFRKAMIAIALIGILAIGGFTIILVLKGVIRPIKSITEAMRELAAGNRQVEIPGLDRSDELGEMAASVAIFKTSMIQNEEHEALERERLKSEQKREEAERQKQREAMEQRDKRAKNIEQLNNAFDQQVSDVLGVVTNGIGDMKTNAEAMSTMADDTTEMSTAVADASVNAANNVQAVAETTNDMTNAIGEVVQQASQASEISAAAVAEVQSASTQIGGLDEAANKIGDVVNLITEIADQTNLLALNATIEAARAGDAGKGFAVVASEVKNLATQTSKATEEISDQINQIQSAARDTVGVIDSIGSIINQVNDLSVTISAAIEKQGSVTREIAQNVELAAGGSQQVNQNIAGVNERATQSRTAASSLLDTANDLGNQSATLHDLVEKYLVEIKAA
jgi:methyl-accepting chemotaxis protein